jgi:hypothetical protein
MNIKRKYVILGLVLLIIAWVGNIYYYENHKLKKPLFIKHYYDIKNGMDFFRLYFIENINDKNEISYVSFPELEDGYISADILNYNSDDRYYRMKIIQARIPRSSDGIVPEFLRNKTITKVRAYTMDGKTYDMDIGKIYLDWDVPGEHSMESTSSGASNNNTGYTTFSSKSDIKIYDVTCKFPELLDGLVEISIKGTPLKDVRFPLELKKGDTITVDYRFMFEKDDIRQNNAYECSIDLLTEDESGKKGVSSAFINYWKQFPEEYDIAAMRKDRGDV